MNKWITCIIVIIFPLLVSAQFSDSVNYHFQFNSTGSINKTDLGDAYLLNNNMRFGIKKESISLNATAGWVYGQQQQKQTNNDFNSALDFNLYKTLPHFYYWGLAGYNTSYSLKLNNQQQYGAGVAYNIYDRKNAYLNISDGILYENSDININDTTREIYNTFRNSLRLAFRFTIKDLVTIHSNSFLQNSLNYRDDYIIRSTSGLSLKLYKWLSFTTSLTYNKISRTNKENLLFNYGLSIDKYF
jgi:hypothetical protein